MPCVYIMLVEASSIGHISQFDNDSVAQIAYMLLLFLNFIISMLHFPGVNLDPLVWQGRKTFLLLHTFGLPLVFMPPKRCSRSLRRTEEIELFRSPIWLSRQSYEFSRGSFSKACMEGRKIYIQCQKSTSQPPTSTYIQKQLQLIICLLDYLAACSFLGLLAISASGAFLEDLIALSS